ncbi:MAG: isoprenylcysteine carboxylmethyltransferase family protein [Alphaproteobacteria bacterium]|nr:isoprenylcysteine carboxylmethyltransferase family protein [Alphaproteobacteria bacterium]
MRKSRALAATFAFFLLAPGTVAGFVPWWITGWRVQAAFPGLVIAQAAGIALILLGLWPLVESFARFALEGLGTPAPIAPTKRLVISGFYRFVRNPMYVGVVSLALGQALLFADLRLAVYGAAVWLAMHLFVILYEEPKLARTFGEDYAAFRANVPRWIPRREPWKG